MKKNKTQPYSYNSSSAFKGSNPLSTVLTNMTGRSITNGWDAVCAINIDKANELFALRFADILAQGLENNPLVFSGTSPDGTVILNNITLSQPLIQISLDISGSNVSLSFMLLAGTITTTSSINKGSIASIVNITPNLDLQITAVVPIITTSATTSSNGQILFKVDDASFTINNDVLWDSTTQQVLSEYLSTFIGSSGLDLEFPIATIPNNASGALMPGSYIDFATQQDIANPNDKGRLLIFMSTSFNPNGGTQNFLDVANVVPDSITDGNNNVIPIDNALIISADVFIQNFAEQLSKSLSAYGVTFATGSSNNLPSIMSNDGTFTTQTEPYCWTMYPVGAPPMNAIGWIDVSIPFYELLSISFANTNNSYQLKFNSSSSQVFNSYLNSGSTCSTSNAIGGADTLKGTLSISGTQDIVILQPNNNEVNFQLQDGFLKASISFHGHWYDFFSDTGYKYVNSQIEKQVGAALQIQLSSVVDTIMPSINTFVLENFLFSQDRQIQMQAAYLPGDIAIFGNTQMPNWYLSASNTNQEVPIAVVQAGNSITISSNGTEIPQQVSWNNLPSIGTVIPNSPGSTTAVYTAPSKVATAQVTIISANDSSNPGSKSTLPLIVVPESLYISPSFAVIPAGPNGLPFTAAATSGDTVNWTSSNPNAQVTFNSTSSLTPQVFAGNYQSTQFTIISVNDTINNTTGSAYVLTIPDIQPVVTMQQIIQEGAPGDTISITAVSSSHTSPISTIASWQQFDESNIAGINLPGNGMEVSFTINSDATPGSIIFIVANALEASVPSAIAAVVVTSGNSVYNNQ